MSDISDISQGRFAGAVAPSIGKKGFILFRKRIKLSTKWYILNLSN